MPKDEQTDSVDVFDEYLTVNEIAKTLRLNGQTVRNMIDRGELRAIRVGQRRVRVLRADLDAFLAGQTDAPAQLTPARRRPSMSVRRTGGPDQGPAGTRQPA